MAADQPLPERPAEVEVLFDEDSDQLEAELGKITELGQTLIDAVLEYLPIDDVQKVAGRKRTALVPGRMWMVSAARGSERRKS